MRYRAMAMTAAAVTAGLTMAACSAASPRSTASTAGTAGTKQAHPVHTAPLNEPATLAAVRADAADYLSLASAGQFAITYQMLSTSARQAISQQAWVAVHQACAGTSYRIKHLAVAGNTATVRVALTGGHRGTLTETLVYAAGAWGVSPGDVSLYRHGSVAADVAAARAGGNCAS
jgi:hypothetical protein